MKKRLTNNDTSHVIYALPLVLISTRSPQGIDNVAPYGMIMPTSSKQFAIGVRPQRHTHEYIKKNREFAINYLTPMMKQVCETTGKNIPPEESEFDLAGLNRVEASEIKVALVVESPVNLECKLCWIKKAGDHDIVVGEVVAVWINEELYDEDAKKTRSNFDTLYFDRSNYFSRGKVID